MVSPGSCELRPHLIPPAMPSPAIQLCAFMPMSKLKSRLKRTAIVLAVGFAVWLACSFAVAYRYLGRAAVVFPEPTPAVAWGNFEDVRLTTSDGEQIGAWFIPGGAEKPVVLLLHGNGGCRTGCVPLAEQLVAEQYSVFMPTFRTHGDSSGKLNDFGFSARRDVEAAIAWLQQNRPGSKIVVWGQSLGAAAAIFAAKDLGNSVAGYILECPYKDLHTAVWNRTHAKLPPVLSEVAYYGLLTASKFALPNSDEINCLNAIGNIPASVPVLILAGGADTRAHVDEANELEQRIHDHAKLVTIDGAGHLQLQATDPTAYLAAISEFLSAIAKP
jgi:alpha-beta hydrolase superfamily lysophospholipase